MSEARSASGHNRNEKQRRLRPGTSGKESPDRAFGSTAFLNVFATQIAIITVSASGPQSKSEPPPKPFRLSARKPAQVVIVISRLLPPPRLLLWLNTTPKWRIPNHSRYRW